MIFRRRREFEFPEYYQDEADTIREQTGVRQSPGRLGVHVLILTVILVGFLVGVRVVAGQTMLEKSLQLLVAPVGLVWLGLFCLFYLAVLYRVRLIALLALGLWLIVSVAGNSFVSNQGIWLLEKEFVELTPAEMPEFDVLLLLGGGVGTAPNRHPQLTNAGDRVGQVATLYHAGKVERIVCSGTHSLPPAAHQLTAAEAACRILTQWQVPSDSIEQIGGINTLQELQAFDRWLDGKPDRAELKIGIVTSAWHLPRALRLAKTVGVDAHPVPANFWSAEFRPEPGLIIPSADNLRKTQSVIKEFLAGLLGR